MKVKFIRNIEKKIKSYIACKQINKTNFTIISNNCWGTFIYKKFGLPYQSPFINLYIFAPDYINLLENFSPEILSKLSFIEHKDSKYKDDLSTRNPDNIYYPIGLLDDKYELHFLHYTSNDVAKEKWFSRLERMDFDNLIFKFSESNLFEDNMAGQFDKLDFKNKICFTSKEFPDLKSNVCLKKFEGQNCVDDEWKYSSKEFRVVDYINKLKY